MKLETCLSHPGIALALGIVLVAAWVALYVLSWAWAGSWAWIDDAPSPKASPLISWVMKLRGWELTNSEYQHRRYCKGDETSGGEGGFYYPLLSLLIGPSLALLAFTLYPVTLTAVTLYLLARLARFARRHKKLFDKHLNDPEAHQ